MKILRSGFWACIATFIPALALADICTDVATRFNEQILALQAAGQASLSQTTDPAQQAALRQSFQLQVDQLKMQRDAALTSAGCAVEATPPPSIDPTPDPGVDPGDVGEDPGDVGVDPGEGNVDPGDGNVDPGDDACVPNQSNSCKAQLDAYIAQLKTQKMCPREFSRKVWAKTFELKCYRRHGWGWGRGWGWGHYRRGGATDNCGNVVKKPMRHWHFCWYHHRMCYHNPYKHECGKREGHRCGMAPRKCNHR